MMTKINKISALREHTVSRKTIAGIVFAFAFYAVIKMFFEPSIIDALTNFKYFTNISNLLIMVVLGLYLFNFDEKPWFKYIALIALVNILMTGIIYHLLVNGISSFGSVSFDGHIKHTLNPVLYPIFYYLLVTPSVKISKFWVTLVFPLIYFLFFVAFGQFIEPPYKFMNPYATGNSLIGVLTFCLLVLLPVIAVFTIGLMALKQYEEKKVNSQK